MLVDLEFLTGLPSMQEVAKYQYWLYCQFDTEAPTWEELPPTKQLAWEISVRALQQSASGQTTTVEFWKDFARRRMDRLDQRKRIG